MGLFDKLKETQAAGPASAQPGGCKTESVQFAKLPETLADFQALPQAAMTSPFETAALTVLALCFYPENSELSIAMLDYLKGPQPLSTYEKQFLRDRFSDKDYVPRSYFTGASPANNYTPAEPYQIQVQSNPYSYGNEGYAKLYLHSGGADSPRPVTLRHAKDGKWYLWEQFLLAGIREPECNNPWG